VEALRIRCKTNTIAWSKTLFIGTTGVRDGVQAAQHDAWPQVSRPAQRLWRSRAPTSQ
jgi:hypothetical protein